MFKIHCIIGGKLCKYGSVSCFMFQEFCRIGKPGMRRSRHQSSTKSAKPGMIRKKVRKSTIS